MFLLSRRLPLKCVLTFESVIYPTCTSGTLRVLPSSFARLSYGTKVELKEDSKYVTEHGPQRKTVSINTCGELYEKWRKQNRFWSVPDQGLTFNVKYIDTMKDDGNSSSRVNEDSPVVVALHGAPGSCEDYDLLATNFSDRGVRVISPSFPDFSEYAPGVFRHTVWEKAQFVKDFLQAINVSNVDLLICHSGSSYPGLRLCYENQAPRISALGLLNPTPYEAKFPGFIPWKLALAIVRASEFPLALGFMSMLFPIALKVIKLPVRVEKHMDPLLSLTTLIHGEITKAREIYQELSLRKFPIIMAFAENDKLIRTKLSYKIAYTLGAQDRDLFCFDKDGILQSEGRILRNLKVMTFQEGSHYTLKKYPQIITESMYSFLEEYAL